MRKFLTLCFLGVQVYGAAQVVDTTYFNTYYEQKVTVYHTLPKTKGSIVFLGDSITDIGEWSALWHNAQVMNQGISSDNTLGVLARLDAVIRLQPQKLFIMIGINDIARNTPDTVILANYEKIVARMRSAAPQTKIFIQSVLPTNNTFTSFPRHQNKEAHIRRVNEGLQQLAARTGCTYIDLHSRFTDAQGRLATAYTNDGLHLTGRGYALWKQIISEKGYVR